MEESALISNARQGDLAAYNELVLQYQDVVYSHTLHLLGDPNSADDITQDTFIRAFEKIGGYRGGSFRAWLLRIARNLSFDEMRKWKTHTLLPFEYTRPDGEEQEAVWSVDPDPLPEAQVEQHQLRDNLNACLDLLPESARSVLLLVDAQGLDYNEAASVLGIPTGTVKSRLARARGLMRSLMVRSTPRKQAQDWQAGIFCEVLSPA